MSECVCEGRAGKCVGFLQNYYYDLYGGNHILFTATQSTLVQSNITQVYFNSVCYIYMCATCFDMYLGHPQACQYENLKRTIQRESKVPVFYIHYFYIVKT